ncbi:MAG: putative type II secretion system protein K [Syntrophorhabdus sp. PtaB.Bin047]|nr:MAG: putative type II secretion system protein K [Syntrophorhabdus sp. PtaB.Bin047]
MRREKRFLHEEKGFALIMVLWVIIILMVIVMSFSVLAKTESRAALLFRDSLVEGLLAQAGLERAILEIYYRQENLNKTVVPDSGETLRVDGTAIEGDVGDGRYVVRIFNEAGRINLNTMNDGNKIILDNLLVNLGVPKETADTVVDSALDWMDKDILHRLNGAEDDYYQSLPNPYRAKNGPFDTVEELLLVKGVTPDILFGTKEHKGLIHFVTVYGDASKINVNFAAKEVIMALPGASEDRAAKIIDRRKQAELKTIDDVKGIMGGGYSSASSYIDVAESVGYTVESTGFRGGAEDGHGIRATLLVRTGGTYEYVYYKTPAETTK